ncbi:16S rRNA (uracil(1498)-N(3))-methyltransferase [Ruania alkalisoli]|uniref:Ribosomal RNA small subunit methyltransferase E n=1 Tax=Ruania alkalisoli TaxID=2779775 RepID=A0A7M1SNT0_9MICO|nr:16S rRNA (uracil(1498)-N(3))-methyltransferase [Ruania alkalisoli]QOR69240.1 16S rRNA (uracil(1498)-N(3))-methyltransferase [Ruania alkalisoli]
MSRPVFVVPEGDLDGVSPGEAVAVTGAEGRHAATVRRVRAGEVIDVVDGAGRRVRATVTDVTTGHGAGVDVVADEVTVEAASRPVLVLVQALAKGGRDELAVEAGTEVGVDAVQPWQAERSVSQWRGPKAAKGEARWQQVALAAAKQARRSWVPQVRGLIVGAQLIDEVAEKVASGSAVLVLHEEAGVPITSAEVGTEAPEVLVIVGPEGGLTESEVDSLVAAGAQSVRLGPHVLRTSTAGPVALALLAERLGRWA